MDFNKRKLYIFGAVAMLKYLFILLLHCCATTLLQAQHYYFKNYQVNSGVSSNTITCITQDRKGFLWFGTRNGLNRFDGHTFRIFLSNPADSNSIGSNSILSLFEDKEEQLWVGTYQGIYRYDPLHEKFTALTTLPQSEIRYIKGDGDNNIWIVAGFTLYHYNVKTGVVKPCGAKDEPTTALCVSPNGTLWRATNNGVLQTFDPRQSAFVTYNIAGSLTNKTTDQIRQVCPLGDTALLVGTMKTVLLFNIRSAKVKTLFRKSEFRPGIEIRDILQQKENEIWLGTETGIYIVRLPSGETSVIQKQDDNPYTITDNVVRALYKDREGGTWVGTFFGGISYYSRAYNTFRKYFPQAGTGSLSGDAVHEICSDQFGKMWIGTEDAGLTQLDPKTGHTKHIKPDGKIGSLSYHNLHGLVANGDELWVGTYEHGLDVLSMKSGRVIRKYKAGPGPGSLKSDFIVTLYKTKRGDILAGTWNGLFRYDRQKDQFQAMPFFAVQTQSVHEDADGTLWVGSYGNGVYYYNAAKKDSGNLRNQPGNHHSLGNNYVNSLFEDSRRQLWICTEGGLFRFDKGTRTMTRIAAENGLLDNQVFRVEEDERHQLWISTTKGLLCFNPATGHITVYTTLNGLPTDQFNYNSSFKAPDGTLYFGTIKGMVSFNPAALPVDSFVPPVYITGLEINNKPVAIGENGTPLQQSVTYTNRLTLPYDQSSLTFDVAALSFSLPEKNGYAYKMDGLDKDWTRLNGARRIYYTKLPPGRYTFRVKGASANEVWNNVEKRLAITIEPPLWASTSAYLFYAIIVLGVAGLLFRYYYLAMKEKNFRRLKTFEIEKEREIYHAKIDFFTNITHEIRTPLTLIKLPLDKLLAHPLDGAGLKENLSMMQRNTNRLIDLTNQLLDFRKAEASNYSLTFTNTDINGLLKETTAEFATAAEQKGQRLRLELPRVALWAYVDPEAFRKIITNLLSNALKYAAQEIAVTLLPFTSEDDTFTIEIKNDGFLIPFELKEKVFEPFYRIKETEKQTGAGIGLPLARSLAELHKGVLDLKPPQQGYNTFSLSIPIHQDQEISLLKEAPEQAGDPAAAVAVENAVVDATKPVILLVEDSKEILDFIAKEMNASYTVLKAYNGKEALAVLQNENVQLVVSDIMMPVMDGIELCKKLKSDFQFSHIPIILLTAKNGLQSRVEGLETGADAYIEKPFSLEHLQAQINSLLQNRKIIKDYFARFPLAHLNGIAHSKADTSFLDHLHAVIDENITNMDLDVDQLSKLMNISRPTLYRKIKALSDLTPNELINLSRLKVAAALLSSGQHKVNEVAYMVGYSLQSNFSRDFHKQFGITPSSYISSQHESKAE